MPVISKVSDLAPASPAMSLRHATSATGGVSSLPRRLFGADGLSFSDLLDLVNPLHHIPVLGTAYRKLTHDTLDPAVRVAGGAMFGGPLGAVFAAGGMLLEHAARDPRPDPDVSPVAQTPAENTATTTVPVVATRGELSEPVRGGWLVSAAVTGRIEAFAPLRATPAETVLAETPAPSTPRGGWLVAQAYAASSAPAGPRNLLNEST